MKKNIVIKTLIVGILLGGLFSAAAAEKIEQKPLTGKPNIVFIFIDDMGYGALVKRRWDRRDIWSNVIVYKRLDICQDNSLI